MRFGRGVVEQAPQQRVRAAYARIVPTIVRPIVYPARPELLLVHGVVEGLACVGRCVQQLWRTALSVRACEHTTHVIIDLTSRDLLSYC